MQAEEIRELKDNEILERVAELEEERFRLGFRAATETLEEPLRLRAIRREVARMKTILRERELGKNITAPAAKAEKAGAAGAKARGGKARGGRKS